MFNLVKKGMTKEEKMQQVLDWIEEADAVVIGGASGMSTANGFDYYNQHTPFFEEHFGDFGKIYGEGSAWNLLYHHYRNDEERWAYMARSGAVMLDLPVGKTYTDLYELVKHKDHYIITTNQDAQFSKVFDINKIFTIQGDAHWMQCSERCSPEIYPSEETLHRLNASIVDGKLKTEDVPRCPKCGAVMEPWVKSFIFQYGDYWNKEADKYKAYLEKHKNEKILFLGLGIGRMTPEFIKHPFINMTYGFENARCAFLNMGEPEPMKEVADKTIALNVDILETLDQMVNLQKERASSMKNGNVDRKAVVNA